MTPGLFRWLAYFSEHLESTMYIVKHETATHLTTCIVMSVVCCFVRRKMQRTV